MKKFTFIAVLILFAIAGRTFMSCTRQNTVPEKAIAQTLLLQIDSFSIAKNKLLQEVQKDTPNEKRLQSLFLQTRLTYKRFEWAAEYFSPAVSRFVNGAPVQEIDMTSGQVAEPAGLQVIEGYLFPVYQHDKKKELIQQLQLLQTNSESYKSHFANIDLFTWQIFDAAKQEVFRILSLGITGFDNPLTLKSAQESAASLKSLKTVLSYYEDTTGDENLPAMFDAASHYLNSHNDFNTFNRAHFILKYANPITTSITILGQKLKFPVTRYNRLLNQDAKTLFDKNAFNANAYLPDDSSMLTNAKVTLGKVLFSDPLLSGNGKRSCQTCHQPEKAFTDGMVKNTVIGGNKPIKRNTPTLINAALQPAQFYDLRVFTLEDQALHVVQNKEEMHGSMKLVANRLWENKKYRDLFTTAFPKKSRTSIDTLEVMNALGSYVRSLVYLNSRFDKYMQGDQKAMNQEELKGFNLFMGKAKCATCHYMPLFNGSFPPRYMIAESEVIGVPKTIAQKGIDDDMGRYEVLKTPSFKHAFKITTVRNTARTAPYMHNGVFKTLAQVMDFYNSGGGAGIGFKVNNQTLAADQLHLTEKEKTEIIAFIKSLDSQL